MDEATKKLLAELALSVKALNESVATKFSTAAPGQADAEKDALVTRVLELEKSLKTIQTQKAIRKMAWAVQGKELEAGTIGVSFGKFLKAVETKDEAFFAEMKAANGQSEGTAADGGVTVPVEYATEIIKLERQASIARRICRLFPMGSLTRKVSRQLTNPTVTWTGEAVNHTKTKITLEQITQTAKKLSALVPITEELLADNNVSIDNFIFQVVAEAIGREEDRVAFAGNTGSGDAFMGVLNATGVNPVSMAGATLAFDDIVDLLTTPKAPYRVNGKIVLGTEALRLIMKLKDDNNNPLWTMPIAGAPATILGRPYEETDQLTLSILYGDFGRYLWISDNGTYEVKGSDSASDASGGAGSAFLQDEIWYKFRRREDITVAQPEAFAKMTVA